MAPSPGTTVRRGPALRGPHFRTTWSKKQRHEAIAQHVDDRGVTNVLVGYALAVVTQIVVFSWFGIDTNLQSHLTIGLTFLGVSLPRGYVLRRLFKSLRVRSGI